MTPPRLSGLLSVWEQHLDQGRDVPAADLCPQHPELIEPLQNAIDALKQVRRLLENSTTDGVAPDSVPTHVPPARPATISCPPGYEILGTLGRGGMAVVYRARQVALNRVVALKMILAGSHAGAMARTRFLREAEAVAAMRHPGIVQIYDYGTHEDNPYFALELCEGGSLADQLPAMPLVPWPNANARPNSRQALDLLRRAQRAGYFKEPANIDHLKKDDDLACLRDRADFQAFVQSLTARKW